ncbi:T9SS type A sorting domain-containing protein [uncultured Winogradskyella sp.]|uniref:T9SS type A sorting domain-containing protein n=1 Tax=uncultured Winogradskyella sp. TaxID=395353 RepID=UPI00262A1439|nr:T9SS type A sorting domain-containing protein [uncultured Winogradskyella sp.]
MKVRLLIPFIVLIVKVNAQETITNYFSVPLSQYAIVSGSIDHSPAGANAIWTFTGLTASGTNTDAFAPPTTAESSAYPGTTEVLTITDEAMNENKAFYQVDGSTLSLIGASNAEFTIDYNSDNALLGTYPLSFGNAASVDAIAGQLMAQGQSPNYTGTITTEVEAFGILTFDVAGLGNFNEAVTRIKTEQNISFTISGIFPGSVDIVSYNYYKDSDGALVFRSTEGTVVVNSLGVNDSFSTSEALITNTLSVDNTEERLESVKLYPNPVKDMLHIELPTNMVIESLTFIDVNGRTVLESKNNIVNTNQLESGFYSVIINTEVGYTVRKFIKQ